MLLPAGFAVCALGLARATRRPLQARPGLAGARALLGACFSHGRSTGALQNGAEFRGDCARGCVDQTVLSRPCGLMNKAPPNYARPRRAISRRSCGLLSLPIAGRLGAGAWRYGSGVPVAERGEATVRTGPALPKCVTSNFFRANNFAFLLLTVFLPNAFAFCN